MEMGTFIGEIKTDLNYIKEMINDLKQGQKEGQKDREELRKEIDGKVNKAIVEHIKIYHNK